MSKKAKTSGPTDEVEPEKTPEDAGRDTEVVMDDSAPQDPATDANPPEADPAMHIDPSSPHATPPRPAADPLSPVANPSSPAANLPSPARDTDNPPSPSKVAMMILLSLARVTPALAIRLSWQSITPRKNLLLWAREKKRQIYPAMSIFLPKSFIPVSYIASTQAETMKPVW